MTTAESVKSTTIAETRGRVAAAVLARLKRIFNKEGIDNVQKSIRYLYIIYIFSLIFFSFFILFSSKGGRTRKTMLHINVYKSQISSSIETSECCCVSANCV